MGKLELFAQRMHSHFLCPNYRVCRFLVMSQPVAMETRLL